MSKDHNTKSNNRVLSEKNLNNTKENENNLSIEEIAKLPFWKSLKVTQEYIKNLPSKEGSQISSQISKLAYKNKSKKQKVVELSIGLTIFFGGCLWSLLYSFGVV